MEAEVCMSCMNQKDSQIVTRSNLKKNTLVINQCDHEGKEEQEGKIRRIDTTTRGLSRSRNLAIENAREDILIVADDDEEFDEDVFEKVEKAYEENPDADLILFNVDNLGKRGLGNEKKWLKKLDLLKVSSLQITMKKESIQKTGVRFNVHMGSGTGNGCGEENKFLLDCYQKGLKILFIPIQIATLKDSKSQWFTGYDEKFFYNRGAATRAMLGGGMAFLYGGYYLVFKRSLYIKTISPAKAAGALLKGMWENKIVKESKHD